MTKGRDQGTGIREQEKPALEVLQLIEVGQLAIARGETRKTVDQAALEELAESIRQNGVNEPLIVRLWAEPQAGRKPEQLKYEIVAGQRRWLASKIAGKTHCPCIVRQMTDAEADEQRVVSNLQRENLPPLEEALAIKALLDAPGATLETVGAKLGKLASYISRRLKLLEAVEPVREALRSGAIELGHALELARLDEKQQIRNLSWLRCGFVFRDQEEDSSDDDDLADDSYEEGDDDSFADDAAGWSRVQETGSHWTPTPESVASLRHRINTTMLRVLSEAPFPLDDELPPMACTECPKRTGNAALLFEDCAQDTCTDQECFDAKTKVWVKFQLDEADKAKRPLVMLSDRGWSENKAIVQKWDVVVIPEQKPIVPCTNQEDAIWIDSKQYGHRTMICRDAKCKIHGGVRRGGLISEDPEKAKKKALELKKKLKVEKDYRNRLIRAIANVKVNQAASDPMILALIDFAIRRSDGQKKQFVASILGWEKELFSSFGEKAEKALTAKLSSLAPLDCLRAALLFANSGYLTVQEYNLSTKPKGLEELAVMLGVEPKAVRAGFVDGKPAPTEYEALSKKAARTGRSTPQPAGRPALPSPAKKGAPQKAVKKAAKKAAAKKAEPVKAAKKRLLSPEARKRIAEATKKRWADNQKAAKK